MRQPYSVLVFPARVRGGRLEFLLLRRVPRPDLGLEGFWQGVTGGLEEGEGFEEAARRELEEETGFRPAAVEPVGFSFHYDIAPEWASFYPPGATRIEEHVYIARLEGDAPPVLSGEHDAFRFCDRDEALRLLKYPGNVEGLRRAAEHLASRHPAP